MSLLSRPVAVLLVALSLAANSPAANDNPQSKSNNTATPGTTNVGVTLDVLTNRHPISQYVYGGAYPQDAPTITDSGMTAVRWGGDSTSTYNWQLFTNNAAADYYFEDFGYTEIGDSSSTSERGKSARTPVMAGFTSCRAPARSRSSRVT